MKDCDFNLETGEISNRRDFDEGDGDFVRTYVPEEEVRSEESWECVKVTKTVF